MKDSPKLWVHSAHGVESFSFIEYARRYAMQVRPAAIYKEEQLAQPAKDGDRYLTLHAGNATPLESF